MAPPFSPWPKAKLLSISSQKFQRTLLSRMWGHLHRARVSFTNRTSLPTRSGCRLIPHLRLHWSGSAGGCFWTGWPPYRDSDNVRARYRAKYCKHSILQSLSSLHHQGIFFYPSLPLPWVSYTPTFYASSGIIILVYLLITLLCELYTTGEVRFGYSQGGDPTRTIQKALFFRLKARITSLVARTTRRYVSRYACSLVRT
jgi:hypothetical protein